ncbi:nucleotidyl transferase AbiEii/AbiGii toxin family protein [Ruminococcus albus]|uniref:nucleotidyl transferase AbiEii/AbiGii toxin family protein n=1 Tax=Ruminococcus albus TaxID=1264 RepID=UPI001FA7A951|nr:nucleotidyl transferase AbiEii/AbiGii toxin family protein [Ruminococcus albus]
MKNTDARVLMRIYMMERFLERAANSEYNDNFVIKGGMLVSAMTGVALRSTIDIDTSIRNQNLSAADPRDIIENITAVDLVDGVRFEIKDISDILDEIEYPGIRVILNAVIDRLITPMKIDISTGDAVTPRAIKYDYKLMFDDRSIKLWSYDLETILAEKLRTILARSVLNTRMRDFYDIYILLSLYENKIDGTVFREAFDAACQKRGTVNLIQNAPAIIANINEDNTLHKLWGAYQKKYPYAKKIQYDDIMDGVKSLFGKLA